MNHETTAPNDTVELEQLGVLAGNTDTILDVATTDPNTDLERQLEAALDVLDTDAAKAIIQKIRERNAKREDGAK